MLRKTPYGQRGLVLASIHPLCGSLYGAAKHRSIEARLVVLELLKGYVALRKRDITSAPWH